jgi:nucleotide-binding universal stress UspA family protein
MTGRSPERRIVLGYDGSAGAQHALRWAAERAARSGLAVEVVHARAVHLVEDIHPPLDETVQAAVSWLRARGDLEVREPRNDPGPAAEVLLRHSEGAETVVMGARGGGGFAGLRLGSVADQVAAHAPCPAVVVRASTGQGVVVGVDGSPVSERAVAFAFSEADRTGQPLTAVHAWVPWYADAQGVDLADDLPGADREAALLGERLAGWRERFPDVELRQRVLSVHPSAALVEASADAALVVVGSHGRGGFRGMVLGSVSRALLHHAACTVAVVRPGAAISL